MGVRHGTIKTKILSMTKVLNNRQIGNNYLGLIDVPDRQVDTDSKRPFFGADAISIDSFKIRIPINHVSIVDEELNGTWRSFNDRSGNEDERLARQRKKFIQTRAGIKVNFSIDKIAVSNNQADEFLRIDIPSKVLCNQYFEGIQESTVSILHERLMAMNVAEFSLDTFLSGFATDVDFKRDCIRGNEAEEQIKGLYYNSIRPEGSRIFTKPDNFGCQLSFRECVDAIKSPFFKIYDKGRALVYKDYMFNDTYLREIDISGIYRTEVTLKNRRHFKYLFGDSPNGTQLGNLIRMPQSEKERIFDHAMKKYGLMGCSRAKKTTREEMSPDDKIKIHLLKELRRVGYPKDKAMEAYLGGFSSERQRSIQSKKFSALWRILEGEKEVSTLYSYEFFMDN